MKDSIIGVFSHYNKNVCQISEIQKIFLEVARDMFATARTGEFKIEANDGAGYNNVILDAKQPDQEGRLYTAEIGLHADGHINVRGSWRIPGKYGEGEHEDATLYFTVQEPSESIVARALSSIQFMDGPISAAVSRYIDENNPSDFEPSH